MNTTDVVKKLVEYVKENGLAIIADDEDMMHEVAKQAIQEALFQPRRIPRNDGWSSRHDEADSPVVEAARQVAAKAAQQVIEEEVSKLMQNPQFRETLGHFLSSAMPAVARDIWERQFFSTFSQASADLTNIITEQMKMQGQLPQNT